MAILPADKLKRLIQFCGMLGSDFPGERANAAKMANDLLREHKLTWEEALGGAKPNGANPFTPPPPGWKSSKPVAWREQARECLEYPDEMSSWEAEFLASILKQPRATLSPKQSAVLDKIYGRLFDAD